MPESTSIVQRFTVKCVLIPPVIKSSLLLKQLHIASSSTQSRLKKIHASIVFTCCVENMTSTRRRFDCLDIQCTKKVSDRRKNFLKNRMDLDYHRVLFFTKYLDLEAPSSDSQHSENPRSYILPHTIRVVIESACLPKWRRYRWGRFFVTWLQPKNYMLTALG